MSYAHRHRKKLIKRLCWDLSKKQERDLRQGRQELPKKDEEEITK